MSTDSDRDPALDALWRENSTETPPPDVDAAILAAAHRAAASTPRGRERWLGPRAWRWFVPLAAAALIAVVVVGVKPPSQTTIDDTVQSASDMPAVSGEKQIATPAPEAQRTIPAPASRLATPAPDPKIATPLRKESAPAPAERARDTPRVAQSPAPKVEEKRAQTFAAPAPAGAAGMITAPARPALPDARADGGAALSADDWIARIRALRERGAQDDALRELARFRDAFADADARLPDDLRAWAMRLPR